MLLIVGLNKKLFACGKTSGCEAVELWRRALINHLYWCATSTPNGNAEVMLAKWDSVANHVMVSNKVIPNAHPWQ